jgi:rRNA maturation protein Nop10
MGEKREFEGIGNHACEYEEDYLSVDKWTKRPDDIKGQALSIDELLPPEVRVNPQFCAKFGKEYSLTEMGKCPYDGGSGGICQPPKFKFKITVEIERITDNK